MPSAESAPHVLRQPPRANTCQGQASSACPPTLCVNASLPFDEDEPQVQMTRGASRAVGDYLKVKRPIPMWHENERAGPNVLMRSSLFTIAPLNMKRWVATASKPRDIACLGDYQIRMVGEELRQDDGDVFFGVLHLARVQANRGGTVQFVASEFIRDLGWNRDGHTYKRLHEIFRRLASTLLIVSGKNVTGDEIRETGFTMLEYDYVRDESNRDGGKWQIRIPFSTINLFWVQSLLAPPLGPAAESSIAARSLPAPALRNLPRPVELRRNAIAHAEWQQPKAPIDFSAGARSST